MCCSYDSIAKYLPTETTITIGTVIASLLGAAALPGLLRKAPVNAATVEKDEHTNNKRKIIPAILSGAFFSVGLVVSQMSIPSKIYGFLNVGLMKKGTWDPTLMCVMGGGLIVSFISYQWVKGFNAFKVCDNMVTLSVISLKYNILNYQLLLLNRMPRHLNVLLVKSQETSMFQLTN